MLLKGNKDNQAIRIKIGGRECNASLAKTQLEGVLVVLERTTKIGRDEDLTGKKITGSGLIRSIGSNIDFSGKVEWAKRIQFGNEERTVLQVVFDSSVHLPVNYVAMAMAHYH